VACVEFIPLARASLASKVGTLDGREALSRWRSRTYTSAAAMRWKGVKRGGIILSFASTTTSRGRPYYWDDSSASLSKPSESDFPALNPRRPPAQQEERMLDRKKKRFVNQARAKNRGG
jgi:hypothetical protein